MFDTSAGWDHGLDEAQTAAVTHGDDPLVVMAGAGTGKTRTLTARVAWLLERGIPAERILLLTFTRRAADDMLSRAASMAGTVPGARPPNGGTFHAVAHRTVSAHAQTVGLSEGFTLLDPADVADVMDLMREEFGLSGGETRTPRSRTLVDVYSRCINTQRPLSEVLAVDFPWCEPHLDAIAGLFRAFVERKRGSSLVDFDDLLLFWRALLCHGQLRDHLAAGFDHVLVDEYQDLNSVQVDIVRALRPDGRGLTVVGDDAQAIYGFRGSDAQHLRDLAHQWPTTTVVRLERNFRSRPSILELANVVRPTESAGRLTLFSDRVPGARPRLIRCHDAPAEARAIADSVLESHERGGALRDQVVLVRAAHHSDLVELELSVRHIPYRKFGGLRFLEAAHVKDFVAAGRILDNPSDEVAWFRLLRLHHGIGPSRARALIDTLRPGTADILDRWPEAVANAPAGTRTALAATLGGLGEARARMPARQRAEGILTVLSPLIGARYADAAVRLGDLDRLVAAAGAIPDLAGWLAELTLDPPVSTGALAGPPHLDEDYVSISTIHSAKGLEWPIVHIPHVIDGAFPSDMALTSPAGLDEERRLFYVAITRARDELNLYSPLRLPHHRRGRDDRHSYAPTSRFLDPAALEVLDVHELPPERNRSISATSAGSAPAALSVPVTVDLGALWH
jgi:DNA helicase-2/ATP-dependent DNA helicase PcrA